jgi:glyoxylase-like metal-dependent hydrolase (beta-lactamase superfamily II)
VDEAVAQRAGSGKWSEPGSYPVAPGVHRIPLPLPEDGLRAVNVYAIDDGEDLVLVDGGWSLPESMAALESGLAAIERDPGEIRSILVTHIHRDHYTQAIALRRRYGPTVLLGEGERPTVQRIHSLRKGDEPGSIGRLRTAGAGELADLLVRGDGWRRQDLVDWEFPDTWTSGGSIELRTRTLTAIATPGHTQGHLVFLDERAGLMFTGDHVLPHITPSIGFVLEPGPLPLADFLNSLRLLTGYPDTQLLPAHGPVGPSVHARVAELLAHHDGRLREAADAVRHGAGNAYQAAQVLTWTRRHTPYADLNPFNQMLAVLETAAHLDLLVHRGALSATVTDGVTFYSSSQESGAP